MESTYEECLVCLMRPAKVQAILDEISSLSDTLAGAHREIVERQRTGVYIDADVLMLLDIFKAANDEKIVASKMVDFYLENAKMKNEIAFRNAAKSGGLGNPIDLTMDD